MEAIRCAACSLPYPDEGFPTTCPRCGGVFDWVELPAFDPGRVERGQPGMWRYRHSFGLPAGAPQVSLGEGLTPAVRGEAFGLPLAFKLEYHNPSGSYKDRGSAVLLSHLLARGATGAVEDSSGNAGASFAAYAARAGIKARVFVPDSASGPKRRQIEAYGAELVAIPGPRSAAAEAVRRQAEAGAVYASHAYLPFGMAGIATIAYELVEQIGEVPGTLIAPVGHGSLLLGVNRGFAALKARGLTDRVPFYVGVQAAACAPAVALFNRLDGEISEGQTLAEGVRVRYPLRAAALVAEIAPGQGALVAVEENEIMPARDALARRGFYVEPTSAIVWAALERLKDSLPPPVALLLTGSGFKT
jgi:threonine synthase